MHWTNQRVLITGASTGIGRATALLLAARGAHVFAAARSLDKLEALAAEAAASRGQLVPLPMDVTDAASIDAALAAIDAATSGYGVDVLINNAGYGLLGPLEELDLAALRRQFETNVFGGIALTQRLLPGMRARRRGWIINLSSMGGHVALPFASAYSATKYAIEAFSAALRVEVAPWNIRVAVVVPGAIATDFTQAARRHVQPSAAYPAAKGFIDLFDGLEQGAPPSVVAQDIAGLLEQRWPPLSRVSPRRWAVGLRLARWLPQRLLNLGLVGFNRYLARRAKSN